ncbi:glycoside hydrolase family 16-like protein [Metarhizium robertsii]|uniref:Glycoside hydrolase family 16-like protein n=1 Tax=Metarhizium robertsii TaxID=568076 RepID=A0A014MU99_9HYPO|nr:glycoside hydrolase family 16-like protein [Metarhizium robertsii]
MSGEGYYPHISRQDCSVVGDGCGMETRAGQYFGDAFSSIDGGVYAMEWASDGISAWLFSGHGIPEGTTSGSPNPAAWGVPLARFAGGNGSNIDSYFRDNNIMFDTTFCGGWTGNPSVWDSNATCSPWCLRQCLLACQINYAVQEDREFLTRTSVSELLARVGTRTHIHDTDSKSQ